jgi:hypothetical protein
MINIEEGNGNYCHLIIVHHMQVSNPHIVPQKHVQLICVSKNYKYNEKGGAQTIAPEVVPSASLGRLCTTVQSKPPGPEKSGVMAP